MRYLSKYTNVKLVPIDLNNLKIKVLFPITSVCGTHAICASFDSKVLLPKSVTIGETDNTDRQNLDKVITISYSAMHRGHKTV